MVPAYEVGGDFYDFLVLSEDTVVVMLADVSGKGIPAALLPSALRTLFHVHAPATADPAALAARMSAGLREETGGMPYATAILARFDREPPKMTFVNAGHPPGFLIRDGDPIALESTGMPLGLWPDAKYHAVSIDLRPGDLGVFMTDGVTEALESGTLSIRDALIQAARSGLEDPADLCAYLLRIASEGSGPPGAGDWHDDRTSLAFRVLPTSPLSSRAQSASLHAPVASLPPRRDGANGKRSSDLPSAARWSEVARAVMLDSAAARRGRAIVEDET
jgi:sigma-B regulation protein RsbU (phosphoserine phosphatase)